MHCIVPAQNKAVDLFLHILFGGSREEQEEGVGIRREPGDKLEVPFERPAFSSSAAAGMDGDEQSAADTAGITEQTLSVVRLHPGKPQDRRWRAMEGEAKLCQPVISRMDPSALRRDRGDRHGAGNDSTDVRSYRRIAQGRENKGAVKGREKLPGTLVRGSVQGRIIRAVRGRECCRAPRFVQELGDIPLTDEMNR